MRRALYKLVSAAVIALGGVLVLASPAFSWPQPQPDSQGSGVYGWQNGDAVGTCGDQGGQNYVKDVQAIAWADHAFPSQDSGYVDGYYGPTTDQALRTYQAHHGLSQDACVGYNTWVNMAAYLHFTNWCGYPGQRTYYWQSYYSELIGFEARADGPYTQYPSNTFFDWFDGWREVYNPLTGGSGPFTAC